eukprot:11148247-Karenia_brevis.AAC.1
MVSENLAHATRSVDVLQDFDCRFDADSRHHPVYVHMQINATSNKTHSRRSIDIDVHKLACPAAVSIYKELLAQSKPLPVQSHPEFQFQHAVSVHKHAAETAFKKEARGKRKVHLSDTVFGLVYARKALRN